MNYRLLTLFILALSIGFCSSSFAQRQRDERPTIEDFKGIQYTGDDSTFYINFRFRMQNRLKYTTIGGDDLGAEDFEARIRRLRLRMDGYIYNPRLSYSIQLGFTRGDQDYDDTDVVNIVRDAVVFYSFTDNFYVAFGQNKLPGNRQRVNSSGELQFAERSLVNATFNIDRDFGIKAYYSPKIGAIPIHLKGAISTGEGRVSTTTDNGLAYTGRAEFLPLGEFTNEGDYYEGDLEYEETPKLSFGGGYSYNDRTTRTGGQTGTYVMTPLTLKTTFYDAIFKYRGWAYQVEYMKRGVDNPFTTDEDGEVTYAFKGQGVNQQLSYLLDRKLGYEIAGRYTWIKPHRDIRAYEAQTEVIELGLTKYFRAHRLKLQFNASYNVEDGTYRTSHDGNNWAATFQIELGI
ncbi:Phosphate-selective porin O and P [Parapedobacter luteus]|uniref:Phosphate-selective porin O and P n=1 Tax=Parapedobacter luteus TaxID=623280 RepID=A0A1T5E3Y5_9SPHI|nr:porin [Parapedobacter luteus]SKB78526.1 Phosphate-selective porin O and P [Parapedobacter luteus]